MGGDELLDIVYFEMIENMKDDRCIICFMIEKSMNKFFDDFLYESVNDYSLRERIRKGGICPVHARKLEGFGDVLAHAIIYSDILTNMFKNQSLFEQFSIRKKKNQVQQDICIFCEKEQNFESTYAKSVSYYFSHDQKFKAAFSESGFVCKEHFNQIMSNITLSSTKKELLLLVQKKVDKIVENLEKIKEKNDYRNIHINLTQEEVKAWHKAVEFIAGSKIRFNAK